MTLRTAVFLSILSLALPPLAAQSRPAPKKSGIDLAGLDLSCKPCEDFWRFANGLWVDRNPIPASQSGWGTMSVVSEGNRERLRALLETAAAANAPAGSRERKIGDLFAACMDTGAVEKQGMKPLAKDLTAIEKISDAKALLDTLVAFQKNSAFGPVIVFARQDAKNSSATVAAVAPAGLSLPERDYYFRSDDRTKAIRAEFLVHVAKMLTLAGATPEDAAAQAQAVLAFETKLAEPRLTNVQRRDPNATYHPVGLAGTIELMPSLDWKAVFTELKIPASTQVIVSEPAYMKAVEKEFTATPLATWKTWMRWKTIAEAAPYLAKAFVDESFRFQSTVLTGVKEQQPRWKRCTALVDQTLGDALGEAFVKKHFPPAAKTQMNDLVENLRSTLREQLAASTWMDAETRKNAIEKLNAFRAKIGYPDRWKDYAAVKVDRGDLFGSIESASEFARMENLAKIGKPLDRNEWGMTPPTVNAYYSPLRNEIGFPAGILQPPMFDMDADEAANYGAIGAVIGHEMGHGFDDQGSKFAASGDLRNWWTPEDRKKFEARAECVINQFNTLAVGDGLKHNGRLVVGEALGDLGGLKLAYRAYKRSLGGKEAPVIDGYTGDQRFFLAFARVWATQLRPEAQRLRLATDPHPLGRFRAIGTLQNMPEFHRAFQCKEGDPMVRPQNQQCELW
ncbi:MAG: M13 family metallopeptidase [Acidobacteria bacterium]|nr:M13 family metallopeptidase [Acidobacteriota bacterium]